MKIKYKYILQKFISDRCLERKCEKPFFITIVFNNVSFYKPNRKFINRLQFSVRGKFLGICRLSLGNNFSRKRPIQPEIHSFIDVEGTKYVRKSAEHIGDSPHLHAVLIPHESQSNWWNEEKNISAVSDLFNCDPSIRSFDIKQVANGNEIPIVAS